MTDAASTGNTYADGTTQGEAATDPTPSSGARWLYVQVAQHVELVPDRAGDGAYTLTMSGLQPTVAFTDRPVRHSGHEPTEDFIDRWSQGSDSFADDPPNAELVIFGADEPPTAAALVLTDPYWDPNHPNRLSYRASTVGEQPGPDQIVWGSGALFIDDDAGPSIEMEELM